jgi:uncharacterized protein
MIATARLCATWVAMWILVVPAFAGPYEDAYTAYRAGNYQTALSLLVPLAEQGNARAEALLGSMYDEGKGVSRDDGQALKWYRSAADKGNAMGQYGLGVFLMDGRGGEKPDIPQATELFRKAALQGNAGAQYRLGLIYSEAIGVPEDDVTAAEWFRKSASQGVAEAQVRLAHMHLTGLGVPQDVARAVDWFNKAAVQNNTEAQFSLGVIYSDGNGFSRNLIQAYVWFSLVAAKENEPQSPEAAQRRDALEPEMSADQLREAKRRVREWRPAMRTG